MDLWDPLLDDDDPMKEASPIKAVSLTNQMNQFLNKAFTKRMTGVDRYSLHGQYTQLQNDLTRALFLDAMMAFECSKICKATDRSLYTLQGLILEVIGSLSQL